MRKTRLLFATIVLAAAAAIFCSGCLAMMIPGLAYSGYKYEHDKNQPAASASSAQSTQSSSKATASRQQKIPDSEIE
jgi:NhaP-type Na+/H+ or K+/H+ antiporter